MFGFYYIPLPSLSTPWVEYDACAVSFPPASMHFTVFILVTSMLIKKKTFDKITNSKNKVDSDGQLSNSVKSKVGR